MLRRLALLLGVLLTGVGLIIAAVFIGGLAADDPDVSGNIVGYDILLSSTLAPGIYLIWWSAQRRKVETRQRPDKTGQLRVARVLLFAVVSTPVVIALLSLATDTLHIPGWIAGIGISFLVGFAAHSAGSDWFRW